MPTTGENKFACRSCGRAYRVKTELVGKKVRCKCGNVMRMPEVHAAAVIGDGYELALDEEVAATTNLATPAVSGKCPQCNVMLKPNAVICINCGLDLRHGQAVKTVVTDEPIAALQATGVSANLLAMASARSKLDQEDEGSNVFVRMMPLIILIAGILIMYVNAYLSLRAAASVFGGTGAVDTVAAFVKGSITIGITVVLAVPLMFLSILIAARIGSISFGPLLAALFKLTVIAVGVGAVGDLFYYMCLIVDDTGLLGNIMMWIPVLMVYVALLHMFFDLDQFEMMVTIGTMALMRQGVIAFLLVILGQMMEP